jgi:tartrate dehydrogenase/decarboxylase / D-malate dehydrogenase
MRSYKIALIPGDGIGQEVIPAGMQVLDAIARRDGEFSLQTDSFPWGCQYYLDHGVMMPADGMETLRRYDAIYFGAVGLPASVPDHISLWGLILPIRKSFDQYVNMRPVRLLPGIPGHLRAKSAKDIDFIVIRENTEGEYSGAGGRVHAGTPQEVAVQTTIFTRMGVERIMRYAFELARTRRKKVTSATKSNAMQHVMVFWDEVFSAVAKDYPDVATEKWHVDALSARFITHPETLDVVVGSNFFADILSDLGGALMGSLGMPASANINPERHYPSMFEPVHGSAPDIMGKGIANPIAAIWAGAMMLDHLGEADAAQRVRAAVEKVTAEGSVLTPDLGGKARTRDVAEAVVLRLS